MRGRKLWMRILAAALAFGMILLVLLLTLSFTGDPVSALLAQRAAEQYIQQDALRSMGFTLSKAAYNFKFGEYLVRAQSDQNQDLHFNLYCKNGKVIRDTYQFDVLENGNVISRFQGEYQTLLQIQMEQAGLGRILLFVEVSEPRDSDIWVPGMPFDPDLPVEKSLHLYPDLEEKTLESAADYLQQVNRFLQEKGYAFSYLSFFDTDDAHTVMIDHIPTEQVGQEDFLAYLKQVQQQNQEEEKEEVLAEDTKQQGEKEEGNFNPTVWVE